MKKLRKLSVLLVPALVMNSMGITVSAEENVIQESDSGFYYIEAEGDRPRLSAASADKFLEVDGEWFKDMNGNGSLDAYEDWRLTSEERTADLLTKMSLKQKAGTLAFGGIGGKNGITVTNFSADDLSTGQTGVSFIQPDSEQMNNETDEYVTVDGVVYAPVAYQVKNMYATTMIAAMTGMPKDQLDVLNKIQSIAEDTELGIPVVFSGDRTYNTWGGMIDAAHYAFGIAGDEELLYNLYSEYAKESVALGYHQVFHGYGNEIGSFYGDDPEYLAKMSALETRAYEDNGFNSHSKHFIARGGRNSYSNAKSPADLIDSWMVGWKAVVDAGTQWIMTNNGEARTEGLQGYLDKETYKLLREDLGYNGIVCLDWPLSADSVMNLTGTTTDGIDVSTLSLGERYSLILDVGIDMFSCYSMTNGAEINETDAQVTNCYHPDALVGEIEAGKYTEEALDVHVARVLKNKFDLGIFENAYRDWNEAVEVLGEAAASADTLPMNNDDINALRRPELTEMEEKLMVESSVLLKNDGILPLSTDKKIYVNSGSAGAVEGLTSAFGEKAEVVGTLEEADVCVIEATGFDDAYELMIEDAQAAGVPVVTVFEGTVSSEPELQQFLDANALLMQTYNNTPDHGSSIGSFYRYVTPSVTVEMLYGEKEPSGKTLFELGYSSDEKTLSWGELQDDIGVNTATRLYMAMLVKENPTVDMPNNLGDVILTTGYGIRYSNPSDISLSLLTLPKVTASVEVERSGSTSTQVSAVNATPKAGEPFEINFVADNKGGAGMTTVQVYDGDQVVAEKVVGLAENQFRVITMDITLEAGEHTITVGDMNQTITVE